MKNFSISDTDNKYDISAAIYKEELNDLKIEKLSNRITILSILIPCLVGALLILAYIDIKERVTDILDTGQTKVQGVEKNFEEKLNAMDVQLAKLRFSMEKTIPELKSQTALAKEEINKTVSAKADLKETKTTFENLQKQIDINTKQNKETLHILDRTGKETLTILNNTSKRITHRLDTEKDEINERIRVMEQEFEKRELAFNNGKEELKKKLVSLEEIVAEFQGIVNELDKAQKHLNTIDNTIEILKKEFKHSLKIKADKKEMRNSLEELENNLLIKIEKLDMKVSTKKINENNSAQKDTSKQIPSSTPGKKNIPPTGTITKIKPGTIIEKDLDQ